jgi:ABC-type multidrug transport system ATPase subunit
VAIGLLPSPPVLLMDEPTAALDPRQRERLWDYLGRLSEDGTAVVFTTHTVSEAERHADRVLVLADGELLFWGSPAELHERAGPAGDLEAAFVAFLRQRATTMRALLAGPAHPRARRSCLPARALPTGRGAADRPPAAAPRSRASRC